MIYRNRNESCEVVNFRISPSAIYFLSSSCLTLKDNSSSCSQFQLELGTFLIMNRRKVTS
jgi:hypothetical protein